MFKKIILVVLVVGLLGGAYGYFFMYNKSHPDYENLEAEAHITAKKLFSACSNDGASKDYTGKLIEISGIPSNIENNDSLVTLVFVFDEGMFGAEGVRATFLPKYNETVKNLTMGTSVTIKGYCTGYNETDVILEKASLIK
jgi:hypothetical protein